MSTRSHYPHLDGLRGLALLLVLFHHLQLITGGYIGVDIFFTLSGYLITQTLNTPLKSFYLRRIARLFPSLFVTLFLTLILFPLPQVAQSSLAAFFSLSNFLFNSQSGYFETSSSEKPLLHTWSLAVEEQFYLIYPILFKTFQSHQLPLILSVIGGVSFLFSSHLVHTSPTAAFFLPHTRIWELLLGAILAICSPPPIKPPFSDLLIFLATFVLLLPAFLYTDHTPFPGPAALPPTLGAAVVIHAGSTSKLAAWLYGTKWIGFVGRVSYSVYLAHWPVIVWLGPTVWAALISTCAGLGLYWGVENVWRLRGKGKAWKRDHWIRWTVFVGLLLMVIVFLGMGLRVTRGEGGEIMFGGSSTGLLNVEEVESNVVHIDWKRVKRLEGWVTGGGGANGEVLVIGDSHAGRMLWLANYLGRKYATKWHVWSLPACLPLFGVKRVAKSVGVGQGRVRKVDEAQCDALVKRWREAVRDGKFKWVFLVGRWSTSVEEGEYWSRGPLAEWRLYQGIDRTETDPIPSLNESRATFQQGLRRTLREIRAAGKQVIIVGEVPDTGRGSFACKRWLAGHSGRRESARTKQPGVCVGAERDLVEKRLRWTELQVEKLKHEMGEGVQILKSRKYMCDNQRQDETHCRVVWGSRMLYRDSDHLSPDGSVYLAMRWEVDRSAWFPWRFE